MMVQRNRLFYIIKMEWCPEQPELTLSVEGVMTLAYDVLKREECFSHVHQRTKLHLVMMLV